MNSHDVTDRHIIQDDIGEIICIKSIYKARNMPNYCDCEHCKNEREGDMGCQKEEYTPKK